MKKNLYFLFIFTISATQSHSQQQPRLSLRAGVAKSIVSAGKSQENTLYRMYDYQSPLPSGIGLELLFPNKWKNTNLFMGAFLEIHPFMIGINPDKFSQPPGGGLLGSGSGSIKFYAGVEKRIGNKEIAVHRNFFTFFGGVSIYYNGKTGGPDGGFSGSVGDGITKDGKAFRGIYYDGRGNPIFADYVSQITPRSAHMFSPDIFGGFRWHIRTIKGKTALTVELSTNIGLTAKHSIDVSYTLDGQYQSDRLKERGASVQLNILIPLKNFGIKRKSN
jgi:hypothetical protein